MALVPNTAIPVSINSVNNSVALGTAGPYCTNLGPGAPFGAYYVDNTNGTTIAYRGFTTVLEAKYPITQNSTYHMKMVVADATDYILDSGVFIEGSSFTAKPANPNAIANVDVNKTRIYPNPFKDKFRIELPTDVLNENLQVEIKNGMGQILYQHYCTAKTLNQNLETATSKLPAGIFYLNLSASIKNFNEVVRLVKMD